MKINRGMRNAGSMQRIESKHITLRMRMKRLVHRTLCLSKTEPMHDLVIGLFVNPYEFGRTLYQEIDNSDTPTASGSHDS